MSQEKVTKYKEEKANRKAIMKKEKIARIVRSCVFALVCACAIGWIGWSGVDYYQNNKPRKQVTVDFNALNDYADGLTAESE